MALRRNTDSRLVKRFFIVIFLIVLLVFGAKRIPEIAKGLGKGITEFKKAAREITDELDTDTDTPAATHVKNELKEITPYNYTGI